MAGDWRLPTIKELESLIDRSQKNPAIPVGHPFLAVNVADDRCWSSTTLVETENFARFAVTTNAALIFDNKGVNNCVWPVRGGL